MIGPSIDESAKDRDGNLRIAKVNVDDNPGVGGTLGIRPIFILMLYKDCNRFAEGRRRTRGRLTEQGLFIAM